VEEGAYFNMGPLYIFSAGIFTLFKIFSIGTDNREFYIYFSALGFLVFDLSGLPDLLSLPAAEDGEVEWSHSLN